LGADVIPVHQLSSRQIIADYTWRWPNSEKCLGGNFLLFQPWAETLQQTHCIINSRRNASGRDAEMSRRIGCHIQQPFVLRDIGTNAQNSEMRTLPPIRRRSKAAITLSFICRIPRRPNHLPAEINNEADTGNAPHLPNSRGDAKRSMAQRALSGRMGELFEEIQAQRIAKSSWVAACHKHARSHPAAALVLSLVASILMLPQP
jgi:hypothetical protein